MILCLWYSMVQNGERVRKHPFLLPEAGFYPRTYPQAKGAENIIKFTFSVAVFHKIPYNSISNHENQ